MSRVEAVEAREESRRERIERLEAELTKARADWFAHKRLAGSPLRALVDECLPTEAGFEHNGLTQEREFSRDTLVEDVFAMLADNSGRFIRAMNPLL